MNYVCGSHRVTGCIDFRHYDDLIDYVSAPNTQSLMLGEEASDFMAFHALNVNQAFTRKQLRIGIILDSGRGCPILCSIHASATLAIGMNNTVQFVNLADNRLSRRLTLDSPVHHILCNDKVMVAVHELGASVIKMSTLQEVENANCDVVADALLSENRLTLVAMDDVQTHIDITSCCD